MKHVLSIDWDFFMDAGSDERFLYFPDSPDGLGKVVNAIIWNTYYTNPMLSKNLLGIKLLDDWYNKVSEICSEFRGECVVCENHSKIYDFVTDRIGDSEPLTVWNLDFHVDMFAKADTELNCGNWVSHMEQHYKKFNYMWIGHSTSALEDKIDLVTLFSKNTKLFMKVKKFDYIFLCRSDIYSPPHFDNKFGELAAVLIDNSDPDSDVEVDVLHPRKTKL